MSLTDSNKIGNLWKKSRGVVDVQKNSPYYSAGQQPFVENILNKDVFSEEVPDELPPGNPINVPGFGLISEYSVTGLDYKFNQIGVAPGGIDPSIPPSEISTVLGLPGYKLTSIGYPQLTYYHRIPLIQHPSANAPAAGAIPGLKSTWYFPDNTNPLQSALRYTINFKKGGLSHYAQRFYIDNGTLPGNVFTEIKEGFLPHLMTFDNKSGYVLLYGENDAASNWKITPTSTATTGPLLVSFIRYEGPLGAGGAGGGLDVSFNNVDISENLISEDTDLIQVSTFEIQRPVVSVNSSNDATQDPNPNIYGYYLIAECDNIRSTSLLPNVYDFTVNLGFFEIEVIDNSQPTGGATAKFKFNSKFYLGINGYNDINNKGQVVFQAIRSSFQRYKNSPIKKIILVSDTNDDKYKVYIHFDYNIAQYGGPNGAGWNDANVPSGESLFDKKLRFQVRITNNDSNKTINYDGTVYDNNWKIKNFDFDDTLPMNEIPGQPSTGLSSSFTMYEYDMSQLVTDEGIRTKNALFGENEVYAQGYNLISKWEKTQPSFPGDFLCKVNFSQNPNDDIYYDKNFASANSMVYLRLSYDHNNSGTLATQAILFNISFLWDNSSLPGIEGNINVLSHHCSDLPTVLQGTGINTIIKDLELIKDSGNTITVLCRCNYSAGIQSQNVECYVELFNNRENMIETVGIPAANFWAPNENFSLGGGGNANLIIDKVDLTNVWTQHKRKLGTNRLILTRDPEYFSTFPGNCPILTENHEILDSTNGYQNYAIKDYSNNLILHAEKGNVIINVNDPNYNTSTDGGNYSNYGGLKIFNSGSSQNSGNIPPAPMIELVSKNGLNNGVAAGVNSNGLPFGSSKIFSTSEGNTVIEGAGNTLQLNTGWTENYFDKSKMTFVMRGDSPTKETTALTMEYNVQNTGKTEITFNETRDDTDTIIFTPNYNWTQGIPTVDKPFAFKVDSTTDKTIIKTDLDVGNNKTITDSSTGDTVVAGHFGRNTKINSYPDHHGQLTNRAYVQEVVVDLSSTQVDTLGVVDLDWVTIAKTGIFRENSSNGNWECIRRDDFRGNAVFEITDKTGSHHHTVKFLANAHFNKTSLKVLSNQYYVQKRFEAIRIYSAGTYDGNVLQVKIRCPAVSTGTATISSYNSSGNPIYDPWNGSNVSSISLKIWQNTNDSGWVVNKKLIEIENDPTLYLIYDPSLPGGSSTSPNPNFGTKYEDMSASNECIVSVDENKVLTTTFREEFFNGILIQTPSGDQSDIALGGGDIETEGGNIYMGSVAGGGGDIEMSGGNITGFNIIYGDAAASNNSDHTVIIKASNTSYSNSVSPHINDPHKIKFDSLIVLPSLSFRGPFGNSSGATNNSNCFNTQAVIQNSDEVGSVIFDKALNSLIYKFSTEFTQKIYRLVPNNSTSLYNNTPSGWNGNATYPSSRFWYKTWTYTLPSSSYTVSSSKIPDIYLYDCYDTEHYAGADGQNYISALWYQHRAQSNSTSPINPGVGKQTKFGLHIPTSITNSGDYIPILWNNYKMPHDGYFTGARIDFSGASGTIKIKNGSNRNTGSGGTIAASSLKLMARMGSGSNERDVVVGTVFTGLTGSNLVATSGTGSHVCETEIKDSGGDAFIFIGINPFVGAPLFNKGETVSFWFHFDKKFSGDRIYIRGETNLLIPSQPASASTYWGPTIIEPYCNFFIPY